MCPFLGKGWMVFISIVNDEFPKNKFKNIICRRFFCPPYKACVRGSAGRFAALRRWEGEAAHRGKRPPFFCRGYTEKRTNFFYLPQKQFVGTRRVYAIQGKFKKRWKRRRFRAIMKEEFCRFPALGGGREDRKNAPDLTPWAMSGILKKESLT